MRGPPSVIEKAGHPLDREVLQRVEVQAKQEMTEQDLSLPRDVAESEDATTKFARGPEVADEDHVGTIVKATRAPTPVDAK